VTEAEPFIRTASPRNYGLQLELPPQPTPPPRLKGLELRARQETTANPSTCGWVDSSEGDPVTCSPGFICGTTQATIVGCCHITTGTALCTDIITSCYDILGAICNASCQANPNNLVCSSPALYCAQYNYPSGSIGLGCAPYTSYTKTVVLSLNSADQGGLLFTSSNSLSATTSPAPSASSSTSPNHYNRLSGGEIAGIAIGCAAGVILAILLFIALLHHRRKNPTQVELPADNITRSPQPESSLVKAPELSSIKATTIKSKGFPRTGDGSNVHQSYRASPMLESEPQYHGSSRPQSEQHYRGPPLPELGVDRVSHYRQDI